MAWFVVSFDDIISASFAFAVVLITVCVEMTVKCNGTLSINYNNETTMKSNQSFMWLSTNQTKYIAL